MLMQAITCPVYPRSQGAPRLFARINAISEEDAIETSPLNFLHLVLAPQWCRLDRASRGHKPIRPGPMRLIIPLPLAQQKWQRLNMGGGNA
jgi:hypothetical protein